MRDVRAPVLADQHLGASGLLGIDGLANQRIEMDFVAGEMKIYPSKAANEEHEAGTKTADLARKHGISEATIYNWKARFGGMDVSEAKRLKALEEENAKLKKLLAEQMLDAAALRELLSKKW